MVALILALLGTAALSALLIDPVPAEDAPEESDAGEDPETPDDLSALLSDPPPDAPAPVELDLAGLRILAGGGGADLLEGDARDELILADGEEVLANLEAPHETFDLSAWHDGAGDTLSGGDGDDTLAFSAGDQASGGAGADLFEIFHGDTEGDEGDAAITDFAKGEDLAVIFIPEGAETVEVDSRFEGTTQTVTVTCDGISDSYRFEALAEELSLTRLEDPFDPETPIDRFLARAGVSGQDILLVARLDGIAGV